MAELTVAHLGKSFGAQRALGDVSFVAEEGMFCTLLGPSGCGKSTTLWSIAGLHTPDRGSISIGDRTVFRHDGTRRDGARHGRPPDDRLAGDRIDVPPEERECGVVFQSYAVWPHMNVADNVGYPLKLRKVARAARRARVEEVLALVELDGLGRRYPHELSGGQQQRVALARALAHQPRLLLLDEPFSNLDAKLRERARTWLRDLQQRVGITTVFVTHDQDEALSMSDRIVVMHDGEVAQIGTPEEVYRHPQDRFVADFVGSINLVPGEITRSGDGSADFVVDGTSTTTTITLDHEVPLGPIDLGVRPEGIRIEADAPAEAGPVLRGTALGVRFLGDHYRHVVRVGSAEIAVQTHLAEIPRHPVLRLPDGCTSFPRTGAPGPEPAGAAAGPTDRTAEEAT